ncbi:hypothetical protein ES705_42042 [subsurface metagenome]
MGVIIISDEIPEIIHNCNRVVVMKEGRIVKEVDTADITEDELFNILARKNK